MVYTTSRETFRKYTDPETFAKIVDYPTVSAMWAHSVGAYASSAAIADDGKEYSYQTLEDDAARLRTVLKKNGLQAGDRVGVYCSNSYAFVKSYLAVVTSGMTALILPIHLDETSVFGCTMKYGLKAVFYQPENEEKTTFARTHGSKAVFLSTEDAETEKTPIFEDVKATDPAVIMFTGGTTGKSKGTLLSNEAVMQGTVNGCYGLKDIFGERYLLVLPLSHVFGLIRNLMSALYTGSTMFICRNNKDMFRDIAMFRPTVMVMVPALAEMALTLSKKFGRNMLGDDLKYVICGAAMVPPYLIREYDKRNMVLLPGYGLTESANLVSGNPENLSHPDSVGLLYPNQELKIENGELLLKGRNIMSGYVGEEEASFDEGGWFHTGDLARIDEDGFLYITGRIKEIIVLPTGENVSPAEVESYFNELTCVQDSQVFEDLNEFGQHILALEVVPRMTELAGVEDVGAFVTAELKKVNEKLPSYMKISRMEIRTSDFERTPSMKIARYHKV
ncbi:MAG: acyl--CoA ligase [Lachnospiraceae bacterium]|nr:acyl--CoA ligase [Lachnospiraceae bacterium]